MDETRQPVIIAALRTPIARAFGALGMVDVHDLAAPLIKALLAETNVAAGTIDDVIMGNAAGGGGNLARLAALTAGMPVDVAGQTVDRQCGSGLEAIIQACRLIAAGAGSYYIAGGAESVSTAPWRVHRPKKPGEMPQFFNKARFSPDEVGDPTMGIAAENVAKQYNITRERQDAFALQSHTRAVEAQKASSFDDEVVPLKTPQGLFEQDDCPRSGLSLQTLARLKPVFLEKGSVTAGNACPLNDGASLVLVTSQAEAKRLGIGHGLHFIDSAVAGVDPNLLGIGSVASTRRLLARNPTVEMADFSLIEFNEAFAAQILASLDALEIKPDAVNRQGGAIALGHPFGASGAVMVTRLFFQMKGMPSGALALATMGIGGGMGLSSMFKPYRAD